MEFAWCLLARVIKSICIPNRIIVRTNTWWLLFNYSALGDNKFFFHLRMKMTCKLSSLLNMKCRKHGLLRWSWTNSEGYKYYKEYPVDLLPIYNLLLRNMLHNHWLIEFAEYAGKETLLLSYQCLNLWRFLSRLLFVIQIDLILTEIRVNAIAQLYKLRTLRLKLIRTQSLSSNQLKIIAWTAQEHWPVPEDWVQKRFVLFKSVLPILNCLSTIALVIDHFICPIE